MVARKRIAVVATSALASVVMYGGLTTPEGTENKPVDKMTVTQSVHSQVTLLPTVKLPQPTVKVDQSKKVEQSKVETVVAAEVKDDPRTDFVPPSHERIADMLEAYIKEHKEKPVSRTKLLKYIKWSEKYTEGTEIDPLWIIAMAFQESKFQERSVSSHGAIGLMQILPSTANSFGVSARGLRNPEVNIATSVKYMSYLLERFETLKMATIAYNQGEGNVSRGTYRSWYYKGVKAHYDAMAWRLNESSENR